MSSTDLSSSSPSATVIPVVITTTDSSVSNSAISISAVPSTPSVSVPIPNSTNNNNERAGSTAITAPPKSTDTASTPSSKAPSSTPPPAVSFRQLFRYADTYDKIMFFLVLVSAAATGVVIPLISLVLGQLLNGSNTANGSDPYGEDLVNKASLYMTLVALGAFIFLGGGTSLAFFSSQRQIHKLRQAYLQALLRQDMTYVDTHSLPEQTARLTEDSLTIQAGIGEKLFLILSGIAQFVGSLALAFTVSSDAWRLALTLCVTLPVAIGAVGFLFHFVASMSGETDDAYARAGEVFVEALNMIRTIATLGGEEHETKRYDTHLATAEKIGLKRGLISGVGQGIFVSVMCSVYAIGLYAGSRFIILNRQTYPECIYDPTSSYNCFTGGTVIQVLFAVIGGAFSIGLVAPNLSYVGSAEAAAARMYKVIDTVPVVDPFSNQGIVPNKPANGKIEFRNVTFAYPSRPDEIVLKDFSFTIPAGTKIALVGPSGSGKSTIIALLQRYYEPFSGSIYLDDVNIKDYNVRWLRNQQALVGQEPQLLPLSIRDNILSGLPSTVSEQHTAEQLNRMDLANKANVSQATIEEAAKVSDAHNFIQSLPKGYDTFVTSSQLSGGQKQRVCIARAIIGKRPILLLDESTASLDSRAEKTVQAAIDKVLSSSSDSVAKFTSISIAHRLSTIVNSDIIIVLEKGKIVEFGTHTELLNKRLTLPSDTEMNLYARLWNLQQASSTVANALPSTASVNALDTLDVTEDHSPTPTTVDTGKLQLRTVTTHSNPLAEMKAGKDDKDVVVTIQSPLAALNGKVPKDAEDGSALKDSSTETVSSAPSSSPSSLWTHVTKIPYRRVWTYLSPEALWLYTGLLFAIINGLLLPAFALLLTEFVVIFYEPDDEVMLEKALIYLGIFFGMAGACFIFNMIQGYSFACSGEPFVRRVRKAAFYAIIQQSIGFLELPANSPGTLTTRLGIDTTKMKLSLGSRLGEKFSAVSTLISGIVLAFTASWQLTLLVILVGPLVVYAADAENRVTFTSNEGVKVAYAEAGAIASDAVNAIRVVHSFNMQPITLHKFTEALEVPYKAGYRRMIGLGIGFGSNQCLQNIVAAIVFKAGLTLQMQNVVTSADVFLVFFAFQFACFGLPQLTALFSDWANIRDALISLFSMIFKTPDIDGSEESVETWKKKTSSSASSTDPKDTPTDLQAIVNGRIEFRNVYFAYPTRPDVMVLQGVSFVIEPGSKIALCGPSGSGKSSIIALLLRWYNPLSGEILIDGQNILSLPARAIRDAIGWVGQEASLFADSCAYNIAYGRAGGIKNKPVPEQGMPRDATPDMPIPSTFSLPDDVVQAAMNANAHNFITQFKHGYATHVGDAGRGVSGGQKQRIACARAIIRANTLKLLLLDEATSALDSESERIVQESIDNILTKQLNKTTSISIAHRLSTIMNSDIIYVIEYGKIVEYGNYPTLVNNKQGLFYKLAEAQGLVA